MTTHGADMKPECKASFDKFVAKKKEVETLEADVVKIRGESQSARFEVEQHTSQLKH